MCAATRIESKRHADTCQLIQVPLDDPALNVATEQIIEYAPSSATDHDF